ncbi:MAG TPA: NmrA family NAD(P)-binding protein [Polyangia bacterium]|nr:NmrA family NAD(P)-binding protein [Polyangia bacterium]
MYVIAGATGHTGSVVASTLLAQGHKVRVIVRDEKKGAAWKDKGAEVALARLENAAELTAALRGADGVYALVPPDFAADDPLAAQTGVAEAWGKAVAAAKPRHVVYLSSIGAELDGGNGPILVAHRAEERLRATGVKVTALRAAYFMENWGGVVHPVRSDGVLPSMITPGRAVPMVATADIGRVAAELLVAGERAPALVELAGPREYSPEDVAAAFAGALDRKVDVVPVPAEGIEPALAQAGFKPKLAALFREMNGAFNAGKLHWSGTPRRGTVAIDEVVRQLVG